jgi:hypothetical protein
MTVFFKVLFVVAAAYLAWRAFKYTHLIERTNRQNKQWLDAYWPEHKDSNAVIADRHRRSMMIDYIVGALCCALVAYFL